MEINEFQSELFRILEERFRELGFETERVPGLGESGRQAGDTLLFLMPVTEKDDRVITDIRFVMIGGERYCIQLFFTIFTDLKDGYEELEKAVPALNFYARFGTYGMLPSQRHFWQRYSVPLRELDLTDGAQGFAVALLDVLDLIREQNTLIYDIIASLASGRTTYEAVVQAGLISEF